MSELTNAFKELNEITDAQEHAKQNANKVVVNGLVFEVSDIDVDLREEDAVVACNISKVDNNGAETDLRIWAIYKATYDSDNFDYIWEEDGDATYAPWGEQSVMYDDGSGSLDRVKDIEANLDFEFEEFEDYDGKAIMLDNALAAIGLDKAAFDEASKQVIESILTKAVAEDIEESILNNSDYWPER